MPQLLDTAWRLPFGRKVYLPSEFLLPADGGLKIQHVTSSHVHAWKHRFEENIPDGIVADATEQEIEHLYPYVYHVKQEVLRIARKKLKVRLLELARLKYGELVSGFTTWAQLASFMRCEARSGRSKESWEVMYGKDGFGPSWEYQYEELICSDISLVKKASHGS